MDNDFSLCHHVDWNNHRSKSYLYSYYVTYPKTIMDGELKYKQKLAAVAYIKKLSKYLFGGSEKNHENWVSGPKIEHGTSRRRIKSANHYTTTSTSNTKNV
jgi:hypothetical protein